MAKMKIFNSLEEAEFKSPPKFNSIERKHFFATSIAINTLLENLRTPTNKVYFLITLGYFKARKRFFARQFLESDIQFVANQLKLNAFDVHLETYSKETCSRNQLLILQHFGYSPFNKAAKEILLNEIKRLAKIQSRVSLNKRHKSPIEF